MAARAKITDKQKKKIIADYLMMESYNAVAKKNGVSKDSVRRIVMSCEDIKQQAQRKKEENTIDILAYMESQRDIVCEIISKGLAVLNDPEKLAEATPSQITTALGTLIDKFTMPGVMRSGEKREDDPLTKALKEEAELLNSGGGRADADQ